MTYQIIRIRQDLNNNINNVTKEMLKFKGKYAKIIVKVEDFETKKTYYLLDIDSCNNVWEDSMIEKG